MKELKRFKKAKGIKSIDRFYHCIQTDDFVRDYVDVERFLGYCKQCPNYNVKWTCPPYSFDVMEKYWHKYRYLHLFAFKLTLADDLIENGMTEEDINRLVEGISRQNYHMATQWALEVESENPGSMALTLDGGHCVKCKKCTRPEGKPCRFEKDSRPAIDAIGGNLIKTAEDIFHTKILWIEHGKVPEYLFYILGLLSDEKEIVLDE